MHNKCCICKKEFKKEDIYPFKVRYKSREYIYFKCRKCNTIASKKYRSTEAGKIKFREMQLKNKDKYRIKNNARVLMAYHLSVGHIVKPKKCSICNITKKLDGHHEDYSKPLEVIWMCRLCHKRHDRGIIKRKP